MKLKLAAALIAAMTIPAHAQFYDGNALHNECQSAQPLDRIAGMSYVAAVFDSMYIMDPDAMLNVPNITLGQAFDTVCQQLDQNPQIRHAPAAHLTTVYLSVYMY